MSQIDRRLKNVQQADLSESRINDDFVHFLKTWGQNIFLVAVTIAALAMLWHWWGQQQEAKRDTAWAELAGARLPAALKDVAERHGEHGAIASVAELNAANTYLLSVLTGKRFDRDASAADAAVTPELRTEWLKDADTLFAKVQARAGAASGTGQLGLAFAALFGRAAIAEDLGDLKAAEGYLREIETRAKGTDFADAGTVAAKRIEGLASLEKIVALPTKPVAAVPAAMPGLAAMPPAAPAGDPAPASGVSGEDIVRQLQGGAAPNP